MTSTIVIVAIEKLRLRNSLRSISRVRRARHAAGAVPEVLHASLKRPYTRFTVHTIARRRRYGA
jgi:hypothetical protein